MTLPEFGLFKLHGGTEQTNNPHMHRAGPGYLKKPLKEKDLLLYHSVDPTDSQTDTERGQCVLI